MWSTLRCTNAEIYFQQKKATKHQANINIRDYKRLRISANTLWFVAMRSYIKVSDL